MSRSRFASVLALALAAAVPAPAPAAAATKKRKPTPTATAIPTPTATPAPELHKAAGECLRYEAGAYVMLSEVGQPGRAFRIDSGTDITARPRRGARLRILYVDTADGPVAKKIMPGPEETKE